MFSPMLFLVHRWANSFNWPQMPINNKQGFLHQSGIPKKGHSISPTTINIRQFEKDIPPRSVKLSIFLPPAQSESISIKRNNSSFVCLASRSDSIICNHPNLPSGGSPPAYWARISTLFWPNAPPSSFASWNQACKRCLLQTQTDANYFKPHEAAKRVHSCSKIYTQGQINVMGCVHHSLFRFLTIFRILQQFNNLI